MARGTSGRMTWVAVVGLGALLLASACEGSGGDDGAADAGADGSGQVDGTGPPSACGGIGAGTHVPGGVLTTQGDDKLNLFVGLGGRPLDLVVRAGNTDIVMLGFMNQAVDQRFWPQWGDDRQTVVIGPIVPNVTDAAVTGAVFDPINNKFGGNIVDGRFCFDAPPVTGQPASGSWVFTVYIEAQDGLFRVQGTFAVPGEAVSAEGDTLQINAATGATFSIE